MRNRPGRGDSHPRVNEGPTIGEGRHGALGPCPGCGHGEPNFCAVRFICRCLRPRARNARRGYNLSAHDLAGPGITPHETSVEARRGALILARHFFSTIAGSRIDPLDAHLLRRRVCPTRAPTRDCSPLSARERQASPVYLGTKIVTAPPPIVVARLPLASRALATSGIALQPAVAGARSRPPPVSRSAPARDLDANGTADAAPSEPYDSSALASRPTGSPAHLDDERPARISDVGDTTGRAHRPERRCP